MSTENDNTRREALWAHLRFAVVGPLLAAPPNRGQLRAELERLSEKTWRHPISNKPVQFGLSTIEGWYYKARAERLDPVGVLYRKTRRDRGRQASVSDELRQTLDAQYRDHPAWSYQLHYDNLSPRLDKQPQQGPLPSYTTIRRFMKQNGLLKKKRRRRRDSAPETSPPSANRHESFEAREVRSFESEYVNALWHLDYHHCSRKLLSSQGEWFKPKLMAVLDDRSRLGCHLQWYRKETAEELVHALCQAFMKRGLPRALLSDNGSAMRADEVEQGLARLGIVHETTLPYSPYQNGKQEVFFAQVEGRLIAMLEGVPELSLSLLNEATQSLAGDGVPAKAPLRNPPDSSRTLPSRPHHLSRLSRNRRAPPRFHLRTTPPSAKNRRHRQHRGHSLRASQPFPPSRQALGTLRRLGPHPRFPNGRDVGKTSLPPLPPRQGSQRRQGPPPPRAFWYRTGSRSATKADGALARKVHAGLRRKRSSAGLSSVS